MPSTRRFLLVSGAIAVGAVLVLYFTATTPQAVAQAPTPGGSTHGQPITLQTDRKATQVMTKGQELIEEKEWSKAAEALQFLLNGGEDGFVQITREGPGQKPTTLWVSVRCEANRLLGTMPGEGLKVYEGMYGREASARLTEARTRNDMQMLADVAQRYLHTQAGIKATELIATRFLERDEPMMAALYFERLITGPHGPEMSPAVLLKAALSFYRAGDKASGDDTWKLLVAKAKRDGGINIQGQIVSVDRVREELDKGTVSTPRFTFDTPYYRGSANRTNQSVGGPVSLEPVWSHSTLLARGDGRPPWIETAINEGVRQLEAKGHLPLHAFHPLATNGLVIYRTYDGVYTVNLKEKEFEHRGEKLKIKAGEPGWWSNTDGGIAGLTGEANKKGVLDGWKQQYNQWQGPTHSLFDNSVTGCLSSDGVRVYAVDDLILQPHPFTIQQQRMMFMGNQNNQFGALKDMVERNTLKAYHLEYGSLRWELGGRHDTSDLKDSFFLGAPLPMNGKLYLLNEKDGALRLVCLECKDANEKNPPPPEIVWKQELATAKDKIHYDFNRRLHAAHLAFGDGVLVCPTNAGTVLAVDLLTHSLVWAHSYREPAPVDPKVKPNQFFNPNAANQLYLLNEWKNSAPAIQHGKVVFTAPDSKGIFCLNLKDGREVWKNERAADELYFAGVFHGKAIIVGKNHLRALNLLDGKEVWKVSNTGTPSGQGVASDNVYYLPVKSTADTKEAGVVAIDLAKGAIVSTTKAIKKDGKFEVPGNLIFADGQLISQTLTSIVCYPVLKKEEGEERKDP
ncbi:MAG: PQQ-binding-like beta-propeller repeat protein [Gemmataceae bacterium]|nr:PQQ-binding-like beta-propeller repeat protein [Gemmataceae bacterium]